MFLIKRSLIYSIFIFFIYTLAIAVELPVYNLLIEQSWVDKLNEDVLADVYCPAIIQHNGIDYECTARYRGGTARWLKKKSWRIRFEDTLNPFGVKDINFNCEYRDTSLMRNYISMRLYDYMGLHAPVIDYARMDINGKYNGVFNTLEVVDDAFFNKRGIPKGPFYKAKSHCADMSPIAVFDNYHTAWEMKEGLAGNYSDLQSMFSKFWFFTDKDFRNNIENLIDVDKTIRYFAIVLFNLGADNVSVNLYLYKNPATGLYEILPWDNDATFGNDWSGTFHENYVEKLENSNLNYHNLYRRLIEIPEYRGKFDNYVRQIASEAVPFIIRTIDSLDKEIEEEIEEDITRQGDDEAYERAVNDLKGFILERAELLAGYNVRQAQGITDFTCSNPNPELGSEVLFSVRSLPGKEVFVNRSSGLDFTVLYDSYDLESFLLYDDGEHDDGEKDDGLYAAKVSFSGVSDSLMMICFSGDDGYDYPGNGLHLINSFRHYSYAVNLMPQSRNLKDKLSFGKYYSKGGLKCIELKNISNDTIDLSYTYFNSGDYWQNLLITENTRIFPGAKLLLSNDYMLAENIFDFPVYHANIFFDFKTGDSLRMKNSFFQKFFSRVCPEPSPLPERDYNIVINEINYNSANNSESGDWIELYNNSGEEADLSGFYFRDSEESHRFIIPSGTIIQPGSYLVIVNDSAAFSTEFNGVANIGCFDFGLNGGGEEVILFNSFNEIVDEVKYDDKHPWPSGADGMGHSLELINPDMDNKLAGSWAASVGKGTPGFVNSRLANIDSVASTLLLQNYPNPFYRSTVFVFQLNEEYSDIRIKIMDMQGHDVDEIVFQPGGNKVCQYQWSPAGLASGAYFYRLILDGKIYGTKTFIYYN